MNQQVRLELVWWVFTILAAVGLGYPIIAKAEHYPFTLSNVVFIVAFITLARYIFLLKHTFLAHNQWAKSACIVACIPLISYLINEVFFFQSFIDEQGPEAIFGNVPLASMGNIVDYMKSEMVFFGVGAAITAIIFPFRMLISIWRNRNRGTV